MKLLFLILFLFFVFACTNTRGGSLIATIEGNISGQSDCRLYLVDAKKWKTPLDSAECKNGRFVFHIKTDSVFYPWLASIHFIKNGDADHPLRLQFRNHTLGADSLQYLRDAFYIEPGRTLITGTYGAAPWLQIQGGRETNLYFKNQFTDIGWMGDKDSAKRSEKMKLLESEINTQPWSYFLLQSIYTSKEQYIKEELTALIRLFNDTVKASPLYKQFSDYLFVRPGTNDAYPDIILTAPDGSRQHISDDLSSVNMLVFWASWCAPCRKEMPQLKTLYEKYKARNINLVSISIDTDETQWRTALQQEQPSWRQLIIPEEKIEAVENVFNFTTIPLVVFTGSDGKELGRISDYDPENMRRYDSVLKKYGR